MKNKILIIEDDNEIAEIEKAYLSKEGFDVSVYEDGRMIASKLDDVNPDLIILDLNLPFIDGVEVIKSIRMISNVPVIMVTARNTDIDELLGLERGADDYIRKPFNPNILVARVNKFFKTKEEFEDDVISYRDIVIDSSRNLITISGTVVNLTYIQFNILKNLVKAKGRVLSRYDILDNLNNGEEDLDVYDRTIDAHIKNIRKIVRESGVDIEVIETVRGVGYKIY